jgi:BlaI family transcriptional regulator, penicillinase repressor
MPRETPQPSDAEWKVLNALWRGHPASARELLTRVAREGWAYTTLKTMLSRMQEKGFVRVQMRGQTSWYEPALERHAAQRNAVRRLVERVFEGASGPLLAHLAEQERMSAAERRKLEGWIAEVERKEQKRGQR